MKFTREALQNQFELQFNNCSTLDPSNMLLPPPPCWIQPHDLAKTQMPIEFLVNSQTGRMNTILNRKLIQILQKERIRIVSTEKVDSEFWDSSKKPKLIEPLNKSHERAMNPTKDLQIKCTICLHIID
jgi:hypothetical protein